MRNAASENEFKLRERQLFDIHEAFRSCEEKVEFAMGFLAENVHPTLRDKVQQIGDPADAWDFLKAEFNIFPPDITRKRMDILYKRMGILYQKNCSSLDDYFLQFDILKGEIIKAGGTYTDSQSEVKLILGVKPEYANKLNARQTLATINLWSLDLLKLHLYDYELDDDAAKIGRG